MIKHNKILSFLLAREPSQQVKDNTVFITQIVIVLLGLMTIYNFIAGNYRSALPDIPTLMIAGLIWWLIKEHDIYYPRIVFCIMLPFVLLTTYDSIIVWGAAGAVWCFPITVLLYFCLPERLALISSAIIFSFTMAVLSKHLSYDFTLRLGLALLMVILCCALIFRSLYRYNQKLEDVALKDELTGAYNRTLLQPSLEDAIQANNNPRDGALFPCIFCIDADHFKRINDTYGHDIGDAALVKLVSVLSDNLKHPKDKVFRMGGEEFLVLKHFSSIDKVEPYAKNILTEVNALSLFPDGKSMTVSIGVATIYDYVKHTQTDLPVLSNDELSQHMPNIQLIQQWNHWIKQADDAMYRAKAAGRNRVVMANQKLS